MFIIISEQCNENLYRCENTTCFKLHEYTCVVSKVTYKQMLEGKIYIKFINNGDVHWKNLLEYLETESSVGFV